MTIEQPDEVSKSGEKRWIQPGVSVFYCHGKIKKLSTAEFQILP
jgi:hypothetical protein